MTTWETYPPGYRATEVRTILSAVSAGDSVAVVGLSGAGKSNLLACLTTRPTEPGGPQFVLVDGNRLSQPRPSAFLALMRRCLEAAPGSTPPAEAEPADDVLEALDAAVSRRLREPGDSNQSVCYLLDLSLLVDRVGSLFGAEDRTLYGSLRALRDAHKFRLTYVVATRHALPADTELSELFFGHTVWLGPLSAEDARWTVERYAARAGQAWPEATVAALCAASGRYPSLLRGMCEAHAQGADLDVRALAQHPAVQARVQEFWNDRPDDEELRAAGLERIAVLMAGRPPQFDTSTLTAKENVLLQFFLAHAGGVCEKDDLIRAVWAEDKVFEHGVRDDSLAQLVRRLREKIEPDPANPIYVHTVPGRGYRFSAGPPAGAR